MYINQEISFNKKYVHHKLKIIDKQVVSYYHCYYKIYKSLCECFLYGSYIFYQYTK